jgi:hypothetical protein
MEISEILILYKYIISIKVLNKLINLKITKKKIKIKIIKLIQKKKLKPIKKYYPPQK